MRKILFNLAFLALFITLWKCQVFKEPAAKVMSATLPTPEIEEEADNLVDADFNLQVRGLDGEMVNMEDYRGKVIFLNFWATWCMPCVAELPSIDNLHAQFKDDVAFLLISNESLEKVKSYHTKKEYNVPFQVVDEQSTIPKLYYHESIPYTLLINKEGKIVKSSFGAEDWDDDDFIEELKTLL